MKKLIIIFAALFLIFLAPATFAASDNEISQRDVVLPVGQVVNRDYFAIGRSVEISGTVNGDVYAFGGQVLVDGKVNGDLITAGGTVRVSGEVTQDLRAGGGQVTISGKIGRNITVGGGNVEIIEGATIAGSAVIGGGNVSLAAPIGSNVKIGAGNLTISNKINGDLDAAVSSIRLTSKSEIVGNLTYWSNNQASIDKEAKVIGTVTKKAPPKAPETNAGRVVRGVAGFNIFSSLVGLVSSFIIGLLLISLFPKYTEAAVNTLRKRPWVSLGFGFLALILTPIIFVVLLITVLGIPLAFNLLGFYLITIYLTRLFTILWAGRAIFERTGNKTHEIWALIIGLVIYYLLGLVPIVGGIVTFLVVISGLGTAILTTRDFYAVARKSQSI